MDNNNESFSGDNPVPNNTYYSNKQNTMVTASLVLGILAVISICCVYGSYIFGGIAITLALLSRGKNTKLSTNAFISIILSVIGMIISTIIIVVIMYTAISSYGSFDNFIDNFDTYYEEIYGEEFPFSNDYNYNYNYDGGTYETQPEQPDLPNTLTITF